MGVRDARWATHVVALVLALLAAVVLLTIVWAQAGRAQDTDLTKKPMVTELTATEADQAEALVDGQLIVVLEDDVKEADYKGGKVVAGEDSSIKTVLYEELKGKENKDKLKAKAKEVSKVKGVKLAEPNGVTSVDYTPNDDRFPEQGNLKFVNMDTAWNLQKGAGVRIAVIDSGINKAHDDLDAKVVAERDTFEGDATAQDISGHGTNVASVAAAETDNGYGIAGAGFNAKLVICRAGPGNPSLDYASIARCFNWIQNVGGVSIVNLSFGQADDFSQAVADEIAESQQVYGMAVIASAGNDSSGAYVENYFPANQAGVIGVGSNDDANYRSYFSIRGPHVDLLAPGNMILAARRIADGGGFELVQGTSFSAPTVSGCVALMYERGLSLGQVRNRLFNYAVDMYSTGYDTTSGYGYLNCRRSLDPN